jgi:ubiquinone/menaquinone biosynthesis C-methylase UbiE
MHHASDLDQFVSESARVLKTGGLFITVRDHVILDEEDKKLFLVNHPLQKFYGGENAFTSKQYIQAICKAGLDLKAEIKYYESVINYFPLTLQDIATIFENKVIARRLNLYKKIGVLSYLFPFFKLYSIYLDKKKESIFSDSDVYGRMYSYLATKNK